MHYYVSVTYEVQYIDYDKYRQRYDSLRMCVRALRVLATSLDGFSRRSLLPRLYHSVAVTYEVQ